MMGVNSRKLLIIDDDAVVRRDMAAYLLDRGYALAEADTGVEGLALFDSFQPELVLTDLLASGTKGLDVLEQIHQQAPDVPVIVVSGVGEMNDVVEALRLGASDFLIKPVADMAVLEHAIRQSLEHSDLVAQNRRYREELEQKNVQLEKNLWIFERDQMAGREVQERLLPPSPVTKSGYTLSRYIHPSLYLSGDFIDYAFFMGRYLGFYLTDVAGHGASSAFVTIWLKYLVRNLMRDRSVFQQSTEEYVYTQGPNLLLQGVNRELIASRLNNHLTSFQGTIDCKAHRMRYSVGGHLPMPILITDQGASYLEGRGKALGLFINAEWKVYEIALPEKFAMVIFSDGVLEILGGDSLQDSEALLLEKMSNLSGPLNIELVCRSLGISEDMTDNPDDIAVMMVTRGH